ncbi:MAG: S8 family serine peptidase [Firmicutes bacterium]|nr:S8 family serine peptidase [Bacillota bacterium]
MDGQKESLYLCDLSDRQAKQIDSADAHIIVEKNTTFSASAVDLWLLDEELDEAAPVKQNWNLEMINAAQSQGAAGLNKVKVAVMDSGIDGLSDVPYKESINLVEDEQEITAYMEDMTGHGTAVASIISKINPNAELYSVRVLDSDNTADLNQVLSGIYWCIEHDMDIINMSLGTNSESQILQKAIKDAEANGILVIAAAGNSGNAGVDYPAAYDEVVSVGAIDHKAEKTKLSAVGDEIDVVAPGEDISVEGMFGLHSWADGTSMAAAHATGEASLLWQKDKTKSNGFIRELMENTVKNIGEENQYGKGVLDVAYAQMQYDEFETNYTDAAKEECVIEENTEPVETYTEQEVSLQGKWGSAEHIGSVTDIASGTAISGTALTAIKRGSVYQDLNQEDFGHSSKETFYWWHGSRSYNYFAAYRMATAIASHAGDASKVAKSTVPGIEDKVYNHMKSSVSTSKLGSQSWAAAIDTKQSEHGDLIEQTYATPIYTGSDTRKTKLRKCFLYGMSIHIATDTFAHSAFRSRNINDNIDHTKVNGRKEADDPNVCPKRYEDAKKAARKTIIAYKNSVGDSLSGGSALGDVSCFAPVEYPANRDYYLGKMITYAKAAKTGSITNANIEKWFGSINFSY